MDYSQYEKIKIPPSAPSLIESFRSMGYSAETAVADIIDNSISAGAKHIWINREWKGENSIVTVKDDGCGMTEAELINAMRPGSQNPLDNRCNSDLGRFGLGLKTASFSQCRKLVVCSKKNSKINYLTWDLDYVEECKSWEVYKWMPSQFEHELDDLDSGTIVIWMNLDRLIVKGTQEDNENAQLKFSNTLDLVKRHIAMTFHRFMEDDHLHIYWGIVEIEPWNPFGNSSREVAIQEFPEETFYIGNSSGTIKGVVLPHRSKYTSEEAYIEAGGIKGYLAQQGFYVYRGRRLLVAGDWLNLFKKEDCYKLARIRIDLPNTLDSEWHIDIKKSKAEAPNICKDQLAAYATIVRTQAVSVYRHRGKIIKQKAGQEFQPLWLDKKHGNKWKFVINRNHAMVQMSISMAKENPKKAITQLLDFIESALPSKSIYIKESNDGEDAVVNSFDENTTDNILKEIKLLLDFYKSMGSSLEEAKRILKTQEPYNNYSDLIDENF